MKHLIASLAVIGLSASPVLAQTAQPNAMSAHETTKTTHVQGDDSPHFAPYDHASSYDRRAPSHDALRLPGTAQAPRAYSDEDDAHDDEELVFHFRLPPHQLCPIVRG